MGKIVRNNVIDVHTECKIVYVLNFPTVGQSVASETGIFQGKTFIICGFNDEVTTALGQLVTEAGGIFCNFFQCHFKWFFLVYF